MTKRETDLLKIGEVATAFSVSTQTVRNWVDRELIRAYKTPSGQLRFKREDIDTYLQKVGAA